MDFWTRLIGGSGGQKRRSTANDPQQRLARFKRAYNQILNAWQKSESLASDPGAVDSLRTSFNRLTGILNEESRSPAPHLCLSFASSSHIYLAISKIAATSYNEGLIREAVGFFSALIDSEEEEFLANGRFAQSLMTFISKITGYHGLRPVIGEDVDAEIVELLFGIAAKIRLEPELLPVWFSNTGVSSDTRSIVQQVGFAGIIRKEDFPLCYQLIDHVHHEGRIGDFARTGLLYIFETASKSAELEQWIVESDLATLMASGLGALYSQLSRKLSIIHPKDDLPIILQLSDYPEVDRAHVSAESVFSEDFKIHMDTFLSYLAFWQDVLEHCRSPDVRQTLIDHFHVLFLQQLLYPSLFESSDIDGGSSVAVLNYLRRILDALDHPELVHMILRYLLALPDEHSQRPPSRGSIKKRRSTLMLLSKPHDKEPELNPSIFNLVDLLLNSTQSRNPQTVASALKLVTTILSKNHKYATGTLVNVTEVHIKEPQRTIGALHAEVESYLDLAGDMIPGAELNKEYDAFLKDVLNLLEGHPCSMKFLALHGLNLPNQAAVDFLSAEARSHTTIHHLTAGDALFKSLMSILSNFFTNNVETNLNLTEAIVNLASCPNLRLEGWLAVEPVQYQFASSDAFDEEDEDLKDIYRARRKPKWTNEGAPALMVALRDLHEQIECLREEIPDFNEHVANRKQAFRVHEELNEAMRSTANFPPPTPLEPPKSSHGTPSGPGAWTPSNIQSMIDGAISPLRGQSPRGRAHTIQSVKLSPAPTPRLNPTGSSRGPSRSPQRGRPLSPNKLYPPRQSSITATVLNDVNDAANAGALKRQIRFPLKSKKKGEVEPPETLPEIGEEEEEAAAAAAEAKKEGAEEEAKKADEPAEQKEEQKDEEQPINGVKEEGEEAVNGAANAEAGASSPAKAESETEAFPSFEEPPVPPEEEDQQSQLQQKRISRTRSGTRSVWQEEGASKAEELMAGRGGRRGFLQPEEERVREASLSHVLTNVVILQEFVLELVAILQVRASLFQEVRFV